MPHRWQNRSRYILTKLYKSRRGAAYICFDFFQRKMFPRVVSKYFEVESDAVAGPEHNPAPPQYFSVGKQVFDSTASSHAEVVGIDVFVQAAIAFKAFLIHQSGSDACISDPMWLGSHCTNPKALVIEELSTWVDDATQIFHCKLQPSSLKLRIKKLGDSIDGDLILVLVFGKASLGPVASKVQLQVSFLEDWTLAGKGKAAIGKEGSIYDGQKKPTRVAVGALRAVAASSDKPKCSEKKSSSSSKKKSSDKKDKKKEKKKEKKDKKKDAKAKASKAKSAKLNIAVAASILKKKASKGKPSPLLQKAVPKKGKKVLVLESQEGKKEGKQKGDVTSKRLIELSSEVQALKEERAKALRAAQEERERVEREKAEQEREDRLIRQAMARMAQAQGHL